MEEFNPTSVHFVNRINNGVLVVGNVAIHVISREVRPVRTNHIVSEIVHIGLRSFQLTNVYSIGIVHTIANIGDSVATVVQAVAC